MVWCVQTSALVPGGVTEQAEQVCQQKTAVFVAHCVPPCSFEGYCDGILCSYVDVPVWSGVVCALDAPGTVVVAGSSPSRSHRLLQGQLLIIGISSLTCAPMI